MRATRCACLPCSVPALPPAVHDGSDVLQAVSRHGTQALDIAAKGAIVPSFCLAAAATVFAAVRRNAQFKRRRVGAHSFSKQQGFRQRQAICGASLSLGPRHDPELVAGPLVVARASAEVVDVDIVEAPSTTSRSADTSEAIDAALLGESRIASTMKWPKGLAMVPPDDVRDRIFKTRGMLGKHTLGYIGDVVWEFLVTRHQYMQMVLSPMTESQAARSVKQAKAASMLFNSSLLTREEKKCLKWATLRAYVKKVDQNQTAVEQVGYETYSAACGLRAFLGWLYIDQQCSESRLEAVADELGLLAKPGEEDEMLCEVTCGLYNVPRPATMFFLALAPLGYAALRLYISRYLCERPLRDEEFIYRIKMALRQEELDLAAVGFMRDDATAEELQLMKAARNKEDTYAFAFQCLLGYLALTAPYRLHQIVSGFGWAAPLAGT